MSSPENSQELCLTDNKPVEERLFSDDMGTLTLDARRVLIQLLAGPSLEARRHSKLWPLLMCNESLIRSRLSELFLDLIIDHDLQVAFTRQMDMDGLDAPILLRRIQLTFIDSVLILFLRQKLAQTDAQGVRAVIGAN